MKKYLMTGIAALAMCAGFTSCSHDMEEATPENLAKLEAQKIKQNYEQAFIKKFGEPASNQDWGFSKKYSARTRAHDVNGNLWYQNWVRPINVGEEVADEEAKVLAEFSKLRENAVNTVNIDWNNYWVQQVHQSTNSYLNLNGAETGDIHASMNKIIAYNEVEQVRSDDNGQTTYYSHYEHVNNFNNGTNTTTYTDDVNGYVFVGTTLMKDMGATPNGTPKFGYHNTNDSKDHFEYIIIPGSQIFPNNPEMHKYYYVGFDYQANDEQTATTFRFRPTGANADVVFDVKGVYRLPESNGKTIKTTIYADNGTGTYVPTEVEYTIGEGGTWSIDGYQHPNMWIERDWKFNDWIVRISPAEYVVNYDGRIMAEDLTIGDANADFDFNDVVFDYKLDETARTATIKLRAAGGTLPLYVGNVEVHGKFGQSSTKVMINTGAGVTADAPEYDYVFPSGTSVEAINIPITVVKGENTIELSAEVGKVASKVHVPTTTRWVKERTDIVNAYPLFQGWIATPEVEWWNTYNSEYLW